MRRWRQLTKPLLAAGVPHALVLGNHDDEADLMRAQIVALDQRLKVRCALLLEVGVHAADAPCCQYP